jgi:hypothetical protein
MRCRLHPRPLAALLASLALDAQRVVVGSCGVAVVAAIDLLRAHAISLVKGGIAAALPCEPIALRLSVGFACARATSACITLGAMTATTFDVMLSSQGGSQRTHLASSPGGAGSAPRRRPGSELGGSRREGRLCSRPLCGNADRRRHAPANAGRGSAGGSGASRQRATATDSVATSPQSW